MEGIEIKWLCVGQKHPYGDTHRECEIWSEKELDRNTVLELVDNNGKMSRSEWIDKGSSKTMSEYFAGYYDFYRKDTKTKDGRIVYYYHGIEPYDD